MCDVIFMYVIFFLRGNSEICYSLYISYARSLHLFIGFFSPHNRERPRTNNAWGEDTYLPLIPRIRSRPTGYLKLLLDVHAIWHTVDGYNTILSPITSVRVLRVFERGRSFSVSHDRVTRRRRTTGVGTSRYALLIGVIGQQA